MAGQYTSPTLVLGFTVERYIAICHPFRKERYCTVTVAARVSAAIVIFCLVLASAQVGRVDVRRLPIVVPGEKRNRSIIGVGTRISVGGLDWDRL